MRNLMMSAASALALLCAAGPLSAQTDPAPVPVTEPAPPADPAMPPVSANPVGSAEMPSETPPNPETAAMPVPPAMPADPAYQAAPYKGALTAPPAEAMNKVYPLCTKTLRDSCRNRGGK